MFRAPFSPRYRRKATGSSFIDRMVAATICVVARRVGLPQLERDLEDGAVEGRVDPVRVLRRPLRLRRLACSRRPRIRPAGIASSSLTLLHRAKILQIDDTWR